MTAQATPPRTQPAQPPIARRVWTRVSTANESWTLLALVIIVVFFTIKSSRFFSLTDFSLIAQNYSPILVMAVGQTFIILTAGIDLSVGSVLVVSGVVADEFYLHHGAAAASTGIVWAGVVLGIGTGAAWGALQGFLTAKAKVPPLIVTLAGFGGALGVSYLITGGSDIPTAPAHLANSIGQASFLGVQWLIWIEFVIALLFGLTLAYTRFGRYTYAIGSNPEAARRAGINVDRHLIKVYALSGLLAGVAGIMSLAFYTSTTITGHNTDNLTTITAVVLGGASLFGGRGTIFGTVLGWAIPAVLITGLNIIHVNQYWQDVAIAIVLVAAVYLDQLRRRLRERA